VRFNLANALYTLERKADAVQALLAAVELDPEYVEAWNNLGNIMADVGEIDEALACFARALELEPGYADAHYNLAEVLANEGDYAPAREHWRAYLAADPTSPTADAVRERLARTAKPG
jgi:tetratricopeptide (TPR) repeat protein